MTDLYKILGVEKAASLVEIKAAYKALAQSLHPDRNSDPDAHERMQAIQKAWDVLKKIDRRAAYDATGNIEQNHAKASAQNQLCMYFQKFMQNWDGRADPITSIRMMGANDLTAAKGQIREIEESRKNLKKLEKRFQYNGEGVNALHNIVENTRKSMNKAQAVIEKQITHIELVLELLRDYQGIEDLANQLQNQTARVSSSTYYGAYTGA